MKSTFEFAPKRWPVGLFVEYTHHSAEGKDAECFEIETISLNGKNVWDWLEFEVTNGFDTSDLEKQAKADYERRMEGADAA